MLLLNTQAHVIVAVVGVLADQHGPLDLEGPLEDRRDLDPRRKSGELDGAGGIECITLSPTSNGAQTLSTPIGIGAWAIGGGKWDTKGMNESAT
jgi:hypothetical protein